MERVAGLITAFGGEETKVLHVFDILQYVDVVSHTEMFEQTLQEVEHIEADARLRSLGIEHPVWAMVFYVAFTAIHLYHAV